MRFQRQDEPCQSRLQLELLLPQLIGQIGAFQCVGNSHSAFTRWVAAFHAGEPANALTLTPAHLTWGIGYQEIFLCQAIGENVAACRSQVQFYSLAE